MKKFLNQSRGIAIIYTLLLVSVALAIVFVLSTIFIGKLKLIKESSDSLESIFAADSGIESCLYSVRKQQTPPQSISNCPGVLAPVTLSNGVQFQIVPLDSQSLRSVGIVNGINRALEVNEAF